MIANNFILKPDSLLTPAYRISPFITKDVTLNHILPPSQAIDDYFNRRFQGRSYIYTSTGRSAISAALKYLGLQRDDCVTILTSSGNFYISGCVTREIDKFCQWSRQMEANTRLLFVIHEFGFAYQKLNELKQHNLPIIEDCAHAFLSDNSEHSVGSVGDFTIFSLPKMFPIQIGGLLLCNSNQAVVDDLDPERRTYIQKVLSHYIDQLPAFAQQRIQNYTYLSRLFDPLGLPARFTLEEGSVPGVFMFRVLDESIQLPVIKTFLWNQGIECDIFYGERSLFIPVHPRLVQEDLHYFHTAVRFFLAGKGI